MVSGQYEESMTRLTTWAPAPSLTVTGTGLLLAPCCLAMMV